MVTLSNKRPVYLNLLKIRLPLAGMVSLAHRVSGVLLFLAIPFAVYLLHLSTMSASGFDEALKLLDNTLIKLINTALLWSIAHHFFTGIRFLLIDADIGVDKQGLFHLLNRMRQVDRDRGLAFTRHRGSDGNDALFLVQQG